MTSEAEGDAVKFNIDAGLLRIDQCRHGVFLSLKSDSFIGRSMATYGEWGEGEIEFLTKLVRPGDIIVDAGANIGTHSIAFAHAVGPKGRIFAFEPQPVLHQILAANAVLNGLTQISTINAGLSDENSWIAFPEIIYGSQANPGGIGLEMVRTATDKSPGGRRQRVPIAPLDEILVLDHLRLVKADIEGMEAAMLRGARETLRRLKPTLYLECNEPAGADELIEELASLDYRCFWHVTPLFRAQNWNGVTENHFGNVANFNMLCVQRHVTVNGLTPATGSVDHPITLLTEASKKP